MDFSELGPLTVDCRLCGKPIEREHQESAVMVRVWVKRLGQYRAEGPFHAECGKLRDKQATSEEADQG